MNLGRMKDTQHAGNAPGEAFRAAGCLLHCMCARAGPGICIYFGSLKPRITLQGKTVGSYNRKTGTHAPGVV